MSTWEVVTLTQDDVDSFREPTFAKAWRGYDRNEVAEYVKRLRGRIQVLEHNAAEFESELEQAKARLEGEPDAPGRDESIEPIAERLTVVLQAFDDDMQRIRGEAQVEADELVAAAKADADRIRVDAQANAEELRAEAQREAKEARDQANELLSGLESRRSSLLVEIRTLKDRMLEAARAIIPAPESDRSGDAVTIQNGDVVVSEGERSSVEDRQDLDPVLGDGDRMFEVRRE